MCGSWRTTRAHSGFGSEQLAGGFGVADSGLLVDAEDGREVERVGAVGEGLLELSVDAEPFKGGCGWLRVVQSSSAGPSPTAAKAMMSRMSGVIAVTMASAMSAGASCTVAVWPLVRVVWMARPDR